MLEYVHVQIARYVLLAPLLLMFLVFFPSQLVESCAIMCDVESCAIMIAAALHGPDMGAATILPEVH